MAVEDYCSRFVVVARGETGTLVEKYDWYFGYELSSIARVLLRWDQRDMRIIYEVLDEERQDWHRLRETEIENGTWEEYDEERFQWIMDGEIAGYWYPTNMPSRWKRWDLIMGLDLAVRRYEVTDTSIDDMRDEFLEAFIQSAFIESELEVHNPMELLGGVPPGSLPLWNAIDRLHDWHLLNDKEYSDVFWRMCQLPVGTNYWIWE